MGEYYWGIRIIILVQLLMVYWVGSGWAGSVIAVEFDSLWRGYFIFCNLFGALALAFGGRFSEILFTGIFLTQLVVFLSWESLLSNQTTILLFYAAVLVFYLTLLTRKVRRRALLH